MTTRKPSLFFIMLLALTACHGKACGKPSGPVLNCVAHENDEVNKTCDEYAAVRHLPVHHAREVSQRAELAGHHLDGWQHVGADPGRKKFPD